MQKYSGINLTKEMKNLYTKNYKAWLKKILKKTKINGKISHVHKLEYLVLLQCPYFQFITISIKKLFSCSIVPKLFVRKFSSPLYGLRTLLNYINIIHKIYVLYKQKFISGLSILVYSSCTSLCQNHYFDYCNLVICFEIRKFEASNLVPLIFF